MATAQHFKFRLDELLKTGARLSLHLNLTYGQPLSPPEEVASLVDSTTGSFWSHRQLILRGFSRRVKAGHVQREFTAQLARLREEKIPVTGVDGHHHVHLLPGVAGALH